MTVYYSTLNPELGKALKKRELPIEEVAEVSGTLQAKLKKKNKTFFIICGVCLVLLIALTIYILAASLNTSYIFLAVFSAVLLLWLGWFCNIGALHAQFNHALKKGYPDYYAQYKLK